MGKELPWFKFKCDEWITGNITLCDIKAQGLFTNICAFYWKKKCNMPLANAKERFSKHEAHFKELLDRKIIKVDEDENIIINFLDEQMNEFSNVSKSRAIAGRKGGKAKAKQLLSKAKAKRSNIEIDKEKIKRKEDKEKIKKELTNFDVALKDFEDMRKSIKRPLTDRAKKMILTELNKLSTDEKEQIAILNQSVLHCWQGVFKLDNGKKFNKFNPKLDTKDLYEKNQRIVLE